MVVCYILELIILNIEYLSVSGRVELIQGGVLLKLFLSRVICLTQITLTSSSFYFCFLHNKNAYLVIYFWRNYLNI